MCARVCACVYANMWSRTNITHGMRTTATTTHTIYVKRCECPLVFQLCAHAHFNLVPNQSEDAKASGLGAPTSVVVVVDDGGGRYRAMAPTHTHTHRTHARTHRTKTISGGCDRGNGNAGGGARVNKWVANRMTCVRFKLHTGIHHNTRSLARFGSTECNTTVDMCELAGCSLSSNPCRR